MVGWRRYKPARCLAGLGPVEFFRVYPGQGQHAVAAHLLNPCGQQLGVGEDSEVIARAAGQLDTRFNVSKATRLGIARFISAAQAFAVQGLHAMNCSVEAQQGTDPEDPERGGRGHVSCR